MVTAAKAFLEGGFTEIGTGTLNEALALRRSGVSAPVHLCYQPDIQSAPAVAHAPDVQASHVYSGNCPSYEFLLRDAVLPSKHHQCSDRLCEQSQGLLTNKRLCLWQACDTHTSLRRPVVSF